MAEISTEMPSRRASAVSPLRVADVPLFLRTVSRLWACRGLRVLSQSVALDVGGNVLLLLFRETVLQRSTH